MKKSILICLAAFVSLAALAATASARGAEKSVNVVLEGDNSANAISISLGADGRSYTLESSGPLEVGGTICTHPEASTTALVCEAAPIAGFEVNGNGGDDTIALGPTVPVAVTLRGGPGDDHLTGGAAGDKLIGGPGDDVLTGRGGDDSLFGGPGDDKLSGGPGDDSLSGGPGEDQLVGGPGTNEALQ